jgi:flagellar hook-associated protein 3 FlgL
MAVIPINVARVSQNLRAYNLLDSLRRSGLDLFRVQNQLATGLKVVRPSDDPLRAAAAGALEQRLDLIGQLQQNLVYANSVLAAGESAMADAVALGRQVETIASQTAGDSASPEERAVLVPVVQSVLNQLVAVGNRQHLGAYLFSGHDDRLPPFEAVADGVIYRGDLGRLGAIVESDYQQDTFTLPGAALFAAVSGEVRGVVDLDPALTLDTRIVDLRGATGRGVQLGRIRVSFGAQSVEVDLRGCDTLGDLLDRLNAALGPGIQATLGTQGIQLTGGLGGPGVLTITDVDGGQAAQDLGLTGDDQALPIGGADLNPRLTLRTPLSALLGGLGLDVSSGLILRNGGRSATVDFSDALTLEDVLNRINQAGVGVWARLADDGDRIEVHNRISGADLTIAENGGTLATALGIRSLHGGTLLRALNDGAGIETVAGTDLRVLTADGGAFEVDLDGAVTLQDVVERLNAAGGGRISAGLAATGNGLVITDLTTGPATLRVERANLSPALDGLGLDVPAVGNQLTGRDVNPVRVNSVFTALSELSRALEQDDTRGISRAGQRLDDTLREVRAWQGRLAAQAQAMDERTGRIEDEELATRSLVSQVRDADLSETVVRFQQLQNALQANLSTAARVMNLSLLDYLR